MRSSHGETMELDGRADGKRFVRDDGRGVVVVPNKISPLLHHRRRSAPRGRRRAARARLRRRAARCVRATAPPLLGRLATSPRGERARGRALRENRVLLRANSPPGVVFWPFWRSAAGCSAGDRRVRPPSARRFDRPPLVKGNPEPPQNHQSFLGRGRCSRGSSCAPSCSAYNLVNWTSSPSSTA